MSLLGFPDCAPFDIDPCFDTVEGVESHQLDTELDHVLHLDDCMCTECGIPFMFPLFLI